MSSGRRPRLACGLGLGHRLACAIMVLVGGCNSAKETGQDSGAVSTGGAGATGGAGGSVTDAAVDQAAGLDGPVMGPDTKPGDAAVAGDAGSDAAVFGLSARAAKQTCVPPAQIDQPADKLSATGCVDPTDPKRPAPSLIPYDVISPLWSDGADKQRFLAVPDGATIHVKDCALEPDSCKPSYMGGTTPDEGHFVLPVGTVLVKSFLFGGRFIETRLFVRFTDMWAGYSYQWNDQQTEAALVVEDGLTADIVNGSGAKQSWYFPKRNDCLECHNDTAGGSLGLETQQLDWSMKYPSGVVANQVATLEHIGLFDRPVARLPVLVDYRLQGASGPTLDDKTRSYLHANCAICHRPEGNYSAIDLRFGVPLAMMKICNIDPNKGDQGVTGSKRLAPGDPTKSVMVLRMQAPDKMSGRMPQLATSVLDPTGIGLVTDWIKSITTCP